MPKYNYKCKSCEYVFEAVHTMSERLTYCEKCDTLDSLSKIPANIAVQYRDNKSGKLVEEYIRETKQEVAEEKERLKTEDFE